MASEQFSLCWDNFHVNMSSGMHSLLEKEDLVDVTLAIEGQYLKAHKMVLSVCSPYFRKLFSTNPCKHPIFFMKDVTYEVMNDLLTFMYQGEVQVNQDNLATFIKTAEALQIKGLTGENREVDDALKEVNSLKRPPPFPDEPRNRLNRSKPNSSKKMKTAQESPELQRDDSYIEQTSDAMQLKVEPNEQVEDAESYSWPDDSYLNETENLPDDSQVDEAEECHMMEEEPKAGTSLEGAIPNQDIQYFYELGEETNVTSLAKKQRTPRKLIHNGYVYYSSTTTLTKRYFACQLKKTTRCPGTACLRINVLDNLIVNREHNHPPDWTLDIKCRFEKEIRILLSSMPESAVMSVYKRAAERNPRGAALYPYEEVFRRKMLRWRKIDSLMKSP